MKDFNCATCWHRNCDADKSKPGSNGAALFARWKIDGVGELKTCPLPMITPFSSFMSSLSQHYRDGHLVEAGGILDQPNLYLESMRIFGGA